MYALHPPLGLWDVSQWKGNPLCCHGNPRGSEGQCRWASADLVTCSHFAIIIRWYWWSNSNSTDVLVTCSYLICFPGNMQSWGKVEECDPSRFTSFTSYFIKPLWYMEVCVICYVTCRIECYSHVNTLCSHVSIFTNWWRTDEQYMSYF